MKNTIIKLNLIVIAVVSIFIFFKPTLSVKFFCDDYPLIKYNPYFRDHVAFFKVFHEQKISMGTAPCFEKQIYRPLRTLYYLAIYKIFGSNEFVFHLLSLFFHLLVSFLLWVLLRKIRISTGADRFFEIMIPLIFLFHPIHLENINTINAVSDILGSLLFILSLLIVFNCQKINLPGLLIIALLSYSAMLFKEMFISVPVLLIMYFYKKFSPAQIFILLLVPVAYFLERHYVVGALSQEELNLSFLQHVSYVFDTFLAYFYNFIFPFNLSQYYSQATEFYLNYSYMILGVFTGLCIGLFVFERGRIFLWYFSGFIISTLPVINIIPIKTFINDRLFYFPSMVFVIALFLYYSNTGNIFINHFVKKLVRFVMIAYLMVIYFSGYSRNTEWLDQGYILEKSFQRTGYPVALWTMTYTLFEERQYERLINYFKNNNLSIPENELPRYYIFLCLSSVYLNREAEAVYYFNALRKTSKSEETDSVFVSDQEISDVLLRIKKINSGIWNKII